MIDLYSRVERKKIVSYNENNSNLVIESKIDNYIVNTIFQSSFEYAYNVKIVNFESDSKLKFIHKRAFHQSYFKIINLPKSVTYIRPNAFESIH